MNHEPATVTPPSGGADASRRSAFGFSLGSLLASITILALCLGWWTLSRRSERQIRTLRALHSAQLRYFQEELDRAHDENQALQRDYQDKAPRLDGSRLTGAVLSSRENAFQLGSFRGCQLKGARLEGGNSAFQLARFDNADLSEAHLTGGPASFQMAKFDGANLRDAVLTGSSASFQGVSLENSQLQGARLEGDFGLANVSGAAFEGADLSRLSADAIGSWYFNLRPSYDAKTRFPKGFDPEAQAWRRK